MTSTRQPDAGASRSGAYEEAYRTSLESPEEFWLRAADALDWVAPPTRALDTQAVESGRWFPDGRMNSCANALDRHVAAGHGDRAALIYDSAVLGVQHTYTFAALLDEVARFAGVLAAQGVARGDRVVIYMPMVPEAPIAMLACARLGAVHSVVFGGFAAKELAARIEDAAPKALVTASGGIEPAGQVRYLPIVRSALEMVPEAPEAVIVKQRRQVAGSAEDHPDWLDWDALMAGAHPAGPVTVDATDPLYVLYTSGTTGKPKGVVRDNGGHAVALAWSMRNIFDISPGDVWWCASDVGWVVGHSYIVYAPLLAGATTVLYEGKPVGTPDAGAFWRVISDHRAKALFTAPTAVRAIRKADPDARLKDSYDTSSLQRLFTAGERLDPDTYEWAGRVLDVPVIDNWWQTETGWPITANPTGLEPLPIKEGSSTGPVPGYDVRILDERGEPVEPGTEGNIAIRLPLPPGTLTGLWGDPERFRSSYLAAFPGYYATGDSGYIDADGYIFVLGRSDDVINVAGHRLSTGGMEAVVAGHPDVAECAVIGIRDDLKGQRPSGYVVLKSGSAIDAETLRAELVERVREEIGAVASFKDVTVVEALPKTRSGKILRKTMRQIVDGKDVVVPSTVEDQAVVDALREQLRP